MKTWIAVTLFFATSYAMADQLKMENEIRQIHKDLKTDSLFISKPLGDSKKEILAAAAWVKEENKTEFSSSKKLFVEIYVKPIDGEWKTVATSQIAETVSDHMYASPFSIELGKSGQVYIQLGAEEGREASTYRYTWRWKNSKFELIGKDIDYTDHGALNRSDEGTSNVFSTSYSINYLTGKMIKDDKSLNGKSLRHTCKFDPKPFQNVSLASVPLSPPPLEPDPEIKCVK